MAYLYDMWQKYNKYIVGGTILLVILLIFHYFKEVITYILISWVISLFGTPIMDFFLKKLKLTKIKAGTSIAAFLTILTLFSLIGGILWLFIPVIVQEAIGLSKVDFHAISIALQEPIEKVNTWLRSLGIEPSASAADQVKSLIGSYFDPSKISELFGNLLTHAGSLLIGLFSIVFISFFFLKEQELFTEIVTAAVPEKGEHKVIQVLSIARNLLSRYFGGILLQMLILFVLASVPLLMLGINNAFLISGFYALMNIIPYLGPLIGAAFACMMTISSNLEMDFYHETVPLLVKVLSVFIATKLIDDFILQPFIFSSRVQAHPLEVFIVIMLGARMGGVLGMIIAIPAYTVFRVFAKVFLSEFKVVRKITEDIQSH
ncbi:MAG TPA: AI-2E family transporter [Saprospiraceae bacterium]|nr:AI-2E family transporter [Saprospiraceae bacterium]